MAGADSPQTQTEEDMKNAILECGKIPVQRDTFYEPISSNRSEKDQMLVS